MPVTVAMPSEAREPGGYSTSSPRTAAPRVQSRRAWRTPGVDFPFLRRRRLIEARREAAGRVGRDHALTHAEGKEATGEAQQVVCRRRAAVLGQPVFVEVPARNARVPDPAADDLVAVLLFAQLPKRAALARCGLSRAAHAQGILVLVEQYTGLPRLDVGLCRRHGGAVA